MPHALLELTPPYYWAPNTPSELLDEHQRLARQWQFALRNVMLEAMNQVDGDHWPFIPASHFVLRITQLHPDALSIEEAILWWHPPTRGMTGDAAVHRMAALKAAFDDGYSSIWSTISTQRHLTYPSFDLEIEPKDWVGGTYNPKGHNLRSWGVPKSS